jgi:hypothetical protein
LPEHTEKNFGDCYPNRSRSIFSARGIHLKVEEPLPREHVSLASQVAASSHKLPQNGIFEALRTHQTSCGSFKVRHEEAAAFAACGYAKFTGRLGVCLVTSGPGGIHLLNGLYDAKCDGQPALAITGHTFYDLIGTHYQQDVDLDKLFMDVAAYNQRVMGPAHIVNVAEVIKTALARRTVAHITIPKDIQEWTRSEKERSKANIARHSSDLFAVSYPVPSEQLLRQAADLINKGSRVFCIFLIALHQRTIPISTINERLTRTRARLNFQQSNGRDSASSVVSF